MTFRRSLVRRSDPKGVKLTRERLQEGEEKLQEGRGGPGGGGGSEGTDGTHGHFGKWRGTRYTAPRFFLYDCMLLTPHSHP